MSSITVLSCNSWGGRTVKIATHDNVEDWSVMKAIWNDVVIAESDQTIVVEGNHYFPPDAVKMEYFQNSNTHTVCPWKGLASYYTISVDGKANPDGA
jgi:uncharacterized protein (DUF427 family)